MTAATLRLHLPRRADPGSDWPAANHDRLLRTMARAIERAAADTRDEETRLEIVPFSRTPAAGPVRLLPERPAPRERRDPARRNAAEAAYRIPSFGDGGALVPVSTVTFEPEAITAGRPDAGVIVTSAGDRIMLQPFATLQVIGGGGESVEAGGSPYAIVANVARALRWGKLLFGGQGYAVLEGRTGGQAGRFFVVPLREPLSVQDLGGMGQRQAGDPTAPINSAGHLWPLAEFHPVTVVTREDVGILSNRSRDRWSGKAVQNAVAKVPAAERVVDRFDARMVADALLSAGKRQDGDDGVIDHIVRMDRTIFAAMPWEQRAEYLVLLIDAWTGEREGIAILELMHATRTISELEAIVAILRAKGVYSQLFDDLDGRVFSLLQYLAEFAPAVKLGWTYLVDLVGELGFMPGPVLSLDELERLAGGLADWLVGTVEGVVTLLSHPLQVLEGIGHLAELLWTLQKAKYGDPEARALVSQMVRQAATAGAKALHGLAYAETLGAGKGGKGGQPRIGADIAGRLKYVIFFEVLSWFIGIGEVKAAINATSLGERIAALAQLLRALRFAGKAGEVGAEAARLERILMALAEGARLADRVQILRLAELLPEDLLLAINRLAEAVDLPPGAGLKELRKAVAVDPVAVRHLDEAVDMLAAAERLEAKAGVGAITADMTQGLHRLLRETPWARKSGAAFIDQIPTAHLDEFMQTVRFIHPDHLARWGPEAYAILAQRPRWMAFVREAGSPMLESLFARSGRDAGRLEHLLDGLSLRRESLPDPADYRRFLDRLERGDEAAFAELLGASGTARLRAGNRTHLLADLDSMESAVARDRFAAQLSELTDRELDGLEHIAREYRTGAATQHWPSEVLELPLQARRYLLDLVNDVAPHTVEGLDLVLQPLLEHGARNIQGGLGQLAAGRTVLRRGLGNRLRFEVSQVRREIDIVAEGAGGRIHVEVKTNIDAANPARASFSRKQIIKDLVTHSDNGYAGLYYFYHPNVAGELPQLGQRMLRLFDDPELAKAFQAWGGDLNKARQDFQQWIAPGSGRLTTYDP